MHFLKVKDYNCILKNIFSSSLFTNYKKENIYFDMSARQSVGHFILYVCSV